MALRLQFCASGLWQDGVAPARNNTTGAEVSGSPMSQPLTTGPQRRPATLAMPINSGVRTSLSAIIQLWAIPTLLTVSLGTNALLGFTALIGKEAVSDSPLEIDGVCKAMAMTSSMRS